MSSSRADWESILHLATLACLLLALGGVLLSRNCWQAASEYAPGAPPESFDDLLPMPSPGGAATWDRGWRGIRPSVAAIALASVLILLGLTAVVFASLG